MEGSGSTPTKKENEKRTKKSKETETVGGQHQSQVCQEDPEDSRGVPSNWGSFLFSQTHTHEME
jgi:hypothetical protein